MVNGKASLTTLEGRLVTLESSTLEIDGYAAARNIGVHFDDGLKLFNSSDLGFTDVILESVSAEITEEYSMAGGNLRIAEVPDIDWETLRRVGATSLFSGFWEGKKYVVHSRSTTSSEDCVALFERFSFSELATGVVMSPKPGESADGMRLIRAGRFAPNLKIHVRGLGSVTINELTVDRARQLPSGSGERVKGGELFADGVDTEHPALLLVGDSATAEVMPDSELREEQVIEAASDLVISSTRPSPWAA